MKISWALKLELSAFGGSGYDSDESIGLIATKTLYNGGLLELK